MTPRRYFNFKGTPWGAPASPRIASASLQYICPLQMAGASLLAVGSFIYAGWAHAGSDDDVERGSDLLRLGSGDIQRTLLPADESDV